MKEEAADQHRRGDRHHEVGQPHEANLGDERADGGRQEGRLRTAPDWGDNSMINGEAWKAAAVEIYSELKAAGYCK